MPASGLKVASLRRRLAAAAISAFVCVAPSVAAFAGFGFLYDKYARRQGAEPGGWSPPELSRRFERPLSAASFAVDIQTRNWRTPGYRLLGLRRVDARTGGPVSIHSAAVEAVWAHAVTQTIRVLTRPQQERRRERLEAFKAEMEEFERTHAGDREAIARERVEVFRRHGLGVAGWGCLVPLAPAVLANLSAVASPVNQTLAQRLAGIVVVED